MAKLKIKLVTLGYLPVKLNMSKILNWPSEVFEIMKVVDNYTITKDSDGDDWEFLDKSIESLLPQTFDGNFLVAITNVPLQDNYYSRRLSGNRVCMTFFQMADILDSNSISLENLIYKLLYYYSLTYKKYKNRIPVETSSSHDETRGCPFDKNANKSDVIYSLDKPQICNACVEVLKIDRIPINEIETIQKELLKIKRTLYHRIAAFIKKHPILAILISTTTAFILGILSSIVASYIYDGIIK